MIYLKIKEGNPAPNFELLSSQGHKIRLSDFRGKKFIVLYFYPKDLTPGCTQEACDFSENLSDFEKKNAVILGVSADDLKKHEKFVTKHQLKHLLLSDLDYRVSEAYGVYQEKSLYGKKFMGIVRTTFIIDPKGMIRKIFTKVKVQGHWRKVLEALTNLKDVA